MSKKQDSYQPQSGVVPYLIKNGETKVVLVRSSTNKNWIIPKGGVQKYMSPGQSAAKEAFEEAGVLGKVSKKVLAEYNYNKCGCFCHVYIYQLEVNRILDSWDEMDRRSRIIVSIEKAIKLVKKEQKVALKSLYKMMQ